MQQSLMQFFYLASSQSVTAGLDVREKIRVKKDRESKENKTMCVPFAFPSKAEARNVTPIELPARFGTRMLTRSHHLSLVGAL